MFFYLLFAFTVLPIVELTLLIKVGQQIGAASTIAVVFLTGVAGAGLARLEGLRTLRKIQEQLATGNMPGDELTDGMLILFAGAVLLTPGFVTDAFGLLILFPVTRAIFKRRLKRWFESRVVVQGPMGPGFGPGGSFGASGGFPGGDPFGSPFGQDPFESTRGRPPLDGGGPVIDVEVIDDDDEPGAGR